jgi:hypothetical protein
MEIAVSFTNLLRKSLDSRFKRTINLPGHEREVSVAARGELTPPSTDQGEICESESEIFCKFDSCCRVNFHDGGIRRDVLRRM